MMTGVSSTLKDIRPRAEEKARRKAEELHEKQPGEYRPPGTGFETERARAKQALRDEVNAQTGQSVRKIAATSGPAVSDPSLPRQWQLAELALPLIILLAVQTIFMGLYAYFAVFYLLGHDYDAAVISAGICGLGLGATPTAMANMQSICRRYKPSVKAFLIVPIVGGVILDLFKSILITFFINISRF